MAAGQRFVIFTGANERAVVAVCRYFRQNRIACSLIARPGPDAMRLTRFADWIDATRREDSLNVDDMLACVAVLQARYPGQRLVFLPTAESIIRVLLSNRDAFQGAGLDIPLVDRELYETISDKASFLSLMAGFGVALPARLDSVGPADLPVVAKPFCEVSPRNGRKLYPELIFTSEALSTFLSSDAVEDYFFQTYLNGRSFYFLAYFPQSGAAPVMRYQENLLQQPNGKSMVAARLCDCPDALTEQRLVRGFQSLGFFGFVMVEVIEVAGVCYLIEANPRLWGPFELAIKAGFRPDAMFDDVPQRAGSSKAFYLWTSGMLLTLLGGGKLRCYPHLIRKIVARPLALLRADIYLRADTLKLLGHELRGAFRLGFTRMKNSLKRVDL